MTRKEASGTIAEKSRAKAPFTAVEKCAPSLRLVSDHLAEWQARAARLTDRQREVVRLIADGQDNKTIADALGIGMKTVEKHRQWAYKVLNVHNTALLVRVAVLTGLVPACLPITNAPQAKPNNGRNTSHAKFPAARR